MCFFITVLDLFGEEAENGRNVFAKCFDCTMFAGNDETTFNWSFEVWESSRCLVESTYNH